MNHTRRVRDISVDGRHVQGPRGMHAVSRAKRASIHGALSPGWSFGWSSALNVHDRAKNISLTQIIQYGTATVVTAVVR